MARGSLPCCLLVHYNICCNNNNRTLTIPCAIELSKRTIKQNIKQFRVARHTANGYTRTHNCRSMEELCRGTPR